MPGSAIRVNEPPTRGAGYTTPGALMTKLTTHLAHHKFVALQIIPCQFYDPLVAQQAIH